MTPSVSKVKQDKKRSLRLHSKKKMPKDELLDNGILPFSVVTSATFMIIRTAFCVLFWTVSLQQKYYDGNWTWVAGSKIGNSPANYGLKGVASSSNWPGGFFLPSIFHDRAWLGNRYQSVYTTDPDNHIMYFFGGKTANEWRSDLWSYDMRSGWWTWIAGPNTTYDVGNFGQFGAAFPLNSPSWRMWPAMTFHAPSNSLYFFGGCTSDTGLCIHLLVDLIIFL